MIHTKLFSSGLFFSLALMLTLSACGPGADSGDDSGDDSLYLYVAAGSKGLKVLYRAADGGIQSVGNYSMSGTAVGVCLSGDTAYIANSGFGLVAVDVSNPAAPIFDEEWETDGSASAVAVSGDYAYIADGSNGLVIQQVANVSGTAVTGHCDTSGIAWDVLVEGGYAYVADYSGGLKIFDVSDKSSPDLLGAATGHTVLKITKAGDYIYAACSEDGLVVYDVSDPTDPQAVGNYDPGASEANDVAISGSYAFVADGAYGILIVDIGDPEDPQIADTYDEGFGFYSITILDSRAFVCENGSYYFDELDITDVTSVSNSYESSSLSDQPYEIAAGK
jgi:hypothetical protein